MRRTSNPPTLRAGHPMLNTNNTSTSLARSNGIARTPVAYRSQTHSANGYVLGGGQASSTAGVQIRTERLQAQFDNKIEVFKEKQALKEAKKREEFLKKTAKYAGNVLGRGEVSNNNNDINMQLRTLRLQDNYQKDVEKFKENEEKKKACEEDKIIQKNENSNQVGSTITEADHERALRLRTERLQAQYNRDVNAFKSKQEICKK